MQTTLSATILAALAATAATAAGQTYSLDSVRYTGDHDPLVDFAIEISVDHDEATFTFSQSGAGTITRIWFEDSISGLEDGEIDGWSSGVKFDGEDDDGIQGGGALSSAWAGTLGSFERKKSGGVKNGVDAGEWLRISYEAEDDFFSTGLSRLLRGEARIAMHIQRLADGGSAHYVTTGNPFFQTTLIPLPSASAMAGIALGVIGTRRRR